MWISEDNYQHALRNAFERGFKQGCQKSRRINIINNHKDSTNPPPLRQQLIEIARGKGVEYE